jgi:pimeloyl-ACP methyl ester carboxylesterase
VTGWRAHGLHAAKVSGLIRRGGPGRVSERRRWQWPSTEAAHAHFAAKKAFARWHPEVLWDYIGSGTEPDEQGVRLAFKREIETQIYNTLPHNMASVLRRHPPRCPVGYIGGTRSIEGRQAGFAATRRLVGERAIWIDGSHLFPMEKPAETAAAVLQLLPD